jgi:uncharacterized phage protein gp47/JayE
VGRPPDKSVLKVLFRVLAGGMHLEHGHLDWNARQIIPDTAEAEILERWASIWGLTRKAAAFAQGSITFTGVEGAAIPTGTRAKRADGIEFQVDTAGTIASGTATIASTAVVAGAAGNTDPGETLTLSSPVAAVDPTGTVEAAGIGAGSDEETDDLLRARLLVRLRQIPTGGSVADYRGWALEIAGVTRAWALPNHLGPGTVGVTFVADNLASPIPDSTLVATVQAKMEIERPVTAAVTVFAPIPSPLNPSLQINPNTLDVRTAITLAVEDHINTVAEPGGTLLLSKLREAISTANGVLNSVIISPATDITTTTGMLTTPGSITFNDIS